MTKTAIINVQNGRAGNAGRLGHWLIGSDWNLFGIWSLGFGAFVRNETGSRR
jgi:hypothetical protein